jgi:hypothetical protein
MLTALSTQPRFADSDELWSQLGEEAASTAFYAVEHAVSLPVSTGVSSAAFAAAEQLMKSVVNGEMTAAEALAVTREMTGE